MITAVIDNYCIICDAHMEIMRSSHADFPCVNVVVELHILSLNVGSVAAYSVLDWRNRHKAESAVTLSSV